MNILLMILLAFILIVVAWGVATYNGFIRLRVKVEEAYSSIDIFLKKRYDLVPNLVETVKGYARHERETLTKVIEARKAALDMSQATAERRSQSENALTNALRDLFALAESYPTLKADGQFLDLQQQLRAVEEDLARARSTYNAMVGNFNTKCQTVPANLIADMFHFRQYGFFQVTDERERQNVRVQF